MIRQFDRFIFIIFIIFIESVIVRPMGRRVIVGSRSGGFRGFDDDTFSLDMRAGFEDWFQELACAAFGDFDDFLWRAFRNDAPAVVACLWPQSMTQSAVLIRSRLCSITSTVLPRSTSL
jgi:hypothetical protein